MQVDKASESLTISPQACTPEEWRMVNRKSWDEIRRLKEVEGLSVSEISRRLEVDRKTVRRCLRDDEWHPYTRRSCRRSILDPHREFMLKRAPEVGYSATILFQELRDARGYQGSYQIVKEFVAPIRAEGRAADITQMRFETPPGLQSQIDWGESKVSFRNDRVKLHLFVLTLGYSRRSFYAAFLNEQLGQFLDAHERAFDYFGGHTVEHLYDRPRTVCHPMGKDGWFWNKTFLSFSQYWGFVPRLCSPYRAQTKGKVESGVKYVKRNFLPGRNFVDMRDFDEQLESWNSGIADVRIHGTTHEKPIERFEKEKRHLVSTVGNPGFQLQARLPRMVAEDWLVNYMTNRYSVPYALIGRIVEIEPCGDRLKVYYQGNLIAMHTFCPERHKVIILPEHGPGATPRKSLKSRKPALELPWHPEVEVRDLSIYEQLAEVTL